MGLLLIQLKRSILVGMIGRDNVLLSALVSRRIGAPCCAHSRATKALFTNTRRPGRPTGVAGLPLVDANEIAQQLSSKYDPYLVSSAFAELQGQGLFSSIGEWQKGADGRSTPGLHYTSALCYTDLAARFVELITVDAQHRSR